MADFTVEALGDGAYAVAGRMDFDTVPDMLTASQAWFDEDRDIRVDLAGVTSANSAGMALLIEWRALAAKQGRTITFTEMPTQIRHLADVCRINEILTDHA
ncbi:MAG TPA: hypothetical protein DD979_02825 [Gammaproteobacteria bacterium]|nr:hypothetical protein [Gammaproteobacteria bacterium]